MAEAQGPAEPGGHEKSAPGGQRAAGPLSSLRRLTGHLPRAPLSLVLLLVSLGLFLLLLTILVQVSRVHRSLQRVNGDGQGSRRLPAASQEQMQRGLVRIQQQLAWVNATLAGLCHPCPWSWERFQESCYFFSRSQRSWKASLSACEDRDAHLVVVHSAEEQDFLLSWKVRNKKRTWIGLSDHHKEHKWQWVDDTPFQLSFWKPGEPNNLGDEDCAELDDTGWNDSLCHLEKFWICERPSTPCPDP